MSDAKFYIDIVTRTNYQWINSSYCIRLVLIFDKSTDGINKLANMEIDPQDRNSSKLYSNRYNLALFRKV